MPMGLHPALSPSGGLLCASMEISLSRRETGYSMVSGYRPLHSSQLYHSTVYPKNFHGSSDICAMSFIYSIQIFEMSHQTFGLSHRKCPTCPMIFVNTDSTIHSSNFRCLPVWHSFRCHYPMGGVLAYFDLASSKGIMEEIGSQSNS